MSLSDWIDKYPQVKRLLDEDAEVLEYQADDAGDTQPEAIIYALDRFREEMQRIESSLEQRYVLEDDALYRERIREACWTFEQELQAITDSFTIGTATGEDLDALAANYGLSRHEESSAAGTGSAAPQATTPIFVLTGPTFDLAEARRTRMARWEKDHAEGR